MVEAVIDIDCIYLAHFSGMDKIDTIDDANRLRSDEISTRHTDIRSRHRRVWQSHRQQRLDFDAYSAARFLCTRKRDLVRNAQSAHQACRMLELLQAAF